MFFDRRHFLISENECFLILGGEVEVFQIKGNQHIKINNLSAGSIFGEMAIISNENRSANVKAVAVPTTLLVISEKFLEGNLIIKSKIYKNLSKILSNRLRDTNKEGSVQESVSGLTPN